MSPYTQPAADVASPSNYLSLRDEIGTASPTPTVTGSLIRHSRRRTTRRKSTPSDFAPLGGIPTQHHSRRPSRITLTSTSSEINDESLSDGDQDNVTTKEDRQQVINRTHPFGIRVWNPPLYHEENSTAHGKDDSVPEHNIDNCTFVFNLLWTLFFGWWLGFLLFSGGVICVALSSTHTQPTYGHVLYGLAGFVFYPFNKSIKCTKSSLHVSDNQREVSTSYNDQPYFCARSENDQLLCYPSLRYDSGHHIRDVSQRAETSVQQPPGPTDLPKAHTFRKNWSAERTLFAILLYCLLFPIFLLVAIVCWCLVLPLPMARMLVQLLRNIRGHPLELSFEYRSASSLSTTESESTIILRSSKFIDLNSWKHSYGGFNIVLIDLMAIAILTAIDWLVYVQFLDSHRLSLSPSMFFLGSLLGIIPLVYVIGQAVASISTQSSMGTSAAVNAMFSTIFEVIFYCVALRRGKGELVEGCVIGSILAGVLFLPGLSMCFGALKRKTQRFNAKSASVTSTMLLFAMVGVFSPTLFYTVYGTYVMRCESCSRITLGHQASIAGCRKCSISQPLDLNGTLYIEMLRPFSYLCAFLLLLAYVIGLWFTLRTHSAVIWHESESSHINRSSSQCDLIASHQKHAANPQHVHRKPSYSRKDHKVPSSGVISPTRCDVISEAPELSEQTVQTLPATPISRATVTTPIHQDTRNHVPNWGRRKSLLILLGATTLYCVLAVILIDAVDTILQEFDIEEKSLGLTVFALIPNVTEIWNAILFAANGNIALSLEIGSAYALQVCLLQIPALVFFSAMFRSPGHPKKNQIFPLVFPQWDMFVVIFSVFLHGYMQNEGKSNYFKGSILLLSYIVVIIGFVLSDNSD